MLRFLDSISFAGLVPGTRYNVHRSQNALDRNAVGARHGRAGSLHHVSTRLSWRAGLGRSTFVRDDMLEFPDDENGAVLRQMAAQGIDLVSPRTIEFAHCFPDEARARAFLAAVAGTVREARLLPPDPEEGRGWEVECSERMVPTHAAITETERRLADLAQRFEGYADGWGSLSNSDGSPA